MGRKGKGTLVPADAGIVPSQPGKAKNQLEMAQPGNLKGKVLRVRTSLMLPTKRPFSFWIHSSPILFF